MTSTEERSEFSVSLGIVAANADGMDPFNCYEHDFSEYVETGEAIAVYVLSELLNTFECRSGESDFDLRADRHAMEVIWKFAAERGIELEAR